MVEVFRRCDAKAASLRVKPRALDPRAVYDLEAWVGSFDPQDDILLTGVAPAGRSAAGPAVLATGQARMTGRQLMEEGLLVRLATRPQVAWVVYQRARAWPRWPRRIVLGGEIPLAVTLHGEDSCPGTGGTITELHLGFRRRHNGRGTDGAARLSGDREVHGKTDDGGRQGDHGPGRVAIVVTPVDATPPAIARADCDDPREGHGDFHQAGRAAGAEIAANYTIDRGVRILSASLGEDRATVTLATSPLSPGVSYALTVKQRQRPSATGPTSSPPTRERRSAITTCWPTGNWTRGRAAPSRTVPATVITAFSRTGRNGPRAAGRGLAIRRHRRLR